MPYRLTAWECEWGCGKYLKSEDHISVHEETCRHNPSQRACETCSRYNNGRRELMDCEKSKRVGLPERDCDEWKGQKIVIRGMQ